MQNSNSTRYDSFDFSKAIAAFLVICIHGLIPETSGRGVIIVIARIAVPFFFMCSGFMLFNFNNSKKLTKRIISLVILILLCSIFYFVINIVKTRIMGESITVFVNMTFTNFFRDVFLFTVNPFSGHLWYMHAYLYVLVFHLIIHKRTRLLNVLRYVLPFLMIVGLALGKYSEFFFNKEFPLVYSRNFLFIGISFFYFGQLIRPKFSNIKINTIIASILAIMLIGTSLCERYLIYPNTSVQEYFISTILLCFVLFLFLMSNPEFMKNSILTYIGRKYSLMIYISHVFFYTALYIVSWKYNSYDVYNYYGPIIVFSISVIVAHFYYKSKEFTITKISN